MVQLGIDGIDLHVALGQILMIMLLYKFAPGISDHHSISRDPPGTCMDPVGSYVTTMQVNG